MILERWVICHMVPNRTVLISVFCKVNRMVTLLAREIMKYNPEFNLFDFEEKHFEKNKWENKNQQFKKK